MHRREFLKSISALSTIGLVSDHGSVPDSAPRSAWVERIRPLMGTFVGIAAYGSDQAKLDSLIADCFQFLEEKANCLSDWEEESDTTRLTREKFLAMNACSREFLELARLSKNIQSQTKGLFHPMSFGMSRLWREAKSAGTIPDKIDIRHMCRALARANVSFDQAGIKLHGQNTGFDFGSVGKGYLADRTCEFLRVRGLRFARVDCGGDMRFLGDTVWKVDVEHPRNPGLLGCLSLRGEWAVASSGDYRNTWTVNGRSYHHLISPLTGYPGRLSQQVTVIHPSATYADALATALFFLPVNEGLQLIKSFPGASAIIVDAAQRLHISPGVNFQPATHLPV